MLSPNDMCSIPTVSGSSVSATLERAQVAQDVLKTYSQAAIDAIVQSMVEAGVQASKRLAKLAHEETGFGSWQDKVTKHPSFTAFDRRSKNLRRCRLAPCR
jgi:acetaldehyde dehydrogenase (acetylating)